MPTEPGNTSQPTGRSLRDYITALVAQLGQGEPPALDRLRAVIGRRRALIALDSEAVMVSFHGPKLVVRQVTAPSGEDGPGDLADADGIGAADSAIVLDLLDGRQELADAIARGRISATGSPEAIDMILHAIEILLDASTRVPDLRALSAEFRVSSPADLNSGSNPPSALVGETEEELLARLDLLPGRQKYSRPPAADL